MFQPWVSFFFASHMSGKKNDILVPLESLIDEGSRESVSKIISLLEEYRPKIKIDTEYQKSLKQTLLSQKKSPFSFSFTIPWFTLMSSIWAITTCFIAAFGLYTLWIESTPWTISSSWVSRITPSSMMYSEEKAERFAWDASMIENTTWGASWEREITNMKASISTHDFKVEKSAIDKEVSEIENEVLNIDSLDISTQSPAPTAIQMEPPSNIPWDMVWTANMNQGMMKISPQMALTQSIQSSPKLVYPSIMKVYIKPTPWSQEEIIMRSWSGLITKEFSTEKVSLLENRSKTLAEWKKILSYSIIYIPRTKISRDTSELYYLVPTIEYILQWGEKILIPLIRGYK